MFKRFMSVILVIAMLFSNGLADSLRLTSQSRTKNLYHNPVFRRVCTCKQL